MENLPRPSTRAQNELKRLLREMILFHWEIRLRTAEYLDALEEEWEGFSAPLRPGSPLASQGGRFLMTFQEIIERLNRYWAEHGCLIVQPYDIEVGAGTFNPATSLRTLGPEPWRVAYVEPSRRPTDGRYGENPYRLGHYYQYQVILKPAPPDSQELYLNSLRALGLDPLRNDFRFVEDDWESPTLGASGLGWEVWCNGAEITQLHLLSADRQHRAGPHLRRAHLRPGATGDVPPGRALDLRNPLERKRSPTGRCTIKRRWRYTRYYLEQSTPERLFQWFQDYEAGVSALRRSGACLAGAGLRVEGLAHV
ncbi:MAG: hypothetical protein KatS3mg115_0280 [Candidatus Poribacteria bacterium]|nr:MAG: hypothetical protein KatS3mg115_0280 [Candidatus Poribacteria bacterium]